MSIINFDQDGVLRSYSDSRPSHFIKPLQAFSLLAEDSLASTNGKLELEDFGAGGYQWKLVLYPNGNKRENVEDHISLYLVMAGENSLLPGWEVCVDFRLFLLDQKWASTWFLKMLLQRTFASDMRCGQSYGEEFTAGGYKWKITLYPEGTSDAVGSHCYTSSRHSWGWKRFITLDNFRAADRGFLSKDTCIIEAEVTINGIAMVPCSGSGGKKHHQAAGGRCHCPQNGSGTVHC
ncbi:hypothetical protein M0R45_021239 [Rubus argutus]|uniref:MATH domain-containing protein n=1 Tax=Rubus argutus TaxID=59490 RepID=A0AAW1XAW9_RUBAR